MKPSSVRPLLIASALLIPVAQAQDAPARIREIEQKVLMKQYKDSVRALAASADGADGSSPEAIGKYVQWLIKMDSELDADAKASAVSSEDMRDSASTLNDMAWHMITAPDAARRHPEISLKLATIALELCGGDNELKSNTLDTRARALFLLGKREEAVAEQEMAVAAAAIAKKAGMEATLASYRTNQLPEISPPAGGEQINYWKLNHVPLSKEMERIVRKLDRMIIPAVDFEDVPLEEVVAFLRTKSVEFDTLEPDPARKGLNIVVRPPAPKPAPDSPAPSPRVKSLHLRNLPIAEVLRYVCSVTAMRYKIDDSAVTLVPAGDVDRELFTRTFRVPPDFPSLISANSPSGADRPIQDLLKDNGILFGEGSSVSLPGGDVLLVTNTPTQLDKLEMLLMWVLSEPAPEKPAARTSPDLTQRTLDKIRNIIIPSVDFDDVSLDEAVEFIRNRSIELDVAEPDPMLKGMDFVVRPRTGGGDAVRIRNLHLRDKPIAQVLKSVCDATASRFKVERSIITLVSHADVEKELLTRRFKVPVDFASTLQEESGAAADAPRPPISKLLKSNGIRFGKGSSALLTEEGLLVVTNTPDELDKLEMLISASGGISSPVAEDAELQLPTEGVTRITRKLREIVIPSIQLENVSLEAAVDLLRKKSVELDAAEPDPSLKGLNLVIRPRQENPPPLTIKSLRLRNVPLGEALKYVCQVTRMRYKVDDFAIMLDSQDSTAEDLFTRTFSVPLDFTSTLEPPSGAEEAAADPSGKKPPVHFSVQKLLEANGILFGEGCSAFMTSGGTLIVTNNPMELDKLQQLILALSQPVVEKLEQADSYSPVGGEGDEKAGDPVPDTGKGVPRHTTTEGAAYISRKLQYLILPSVDFEDITLGEAVEILRKQAPELDKREPDPVKKGINFVIRRPAKPSRDPRSTLPIAEPEALRIKNLHLRNVPYEMVLKHLCDATGLIFRVDDFSVTLLQRSVLDEDLLTRTFSVPPKFHSMLNSTSVLNSAAGAPAGRKARPSIVELLKENGIKFDEGTSAMLSPDYLLVTNTPTQLDKIDGLITILEVTPPEKWEQAKKEFLTTEESSVR